jgi:hypothetical protein
VVSFLLAATAAAQATDFHVAADGDDSRDGRSPAQAWRTIGRVNQAFASDAIQAGDRVLFRRGDLFRGSLQLLQNNDEDVEFAAYGAGPRPRWSGARPLGPWVALGSDRWAALCPQPPHLLYVDGTLQQLAREPDVGSFYTDASTVASLSDAALAAVPGSLVGAALVLRNYDWSFVRTPVLSQNGTTLGFAGLVEAPGAGRNYHVEGLPTLLDAPGEWWHDAGQGVLVLQLAAGQQPDGLAIEAVVDASALFGVWNRRSVRVRDLELLHYGGRAIDLRGALCIGNEVRDCWLHDLAAGISVQGPAAVVAANTITDVMFEAIEGRDFGAGSLLVGNAIERVAMRFGGAPSSAAGEFLVDAIDVDCLPGAIVRRNVIDEAGYNGIRVDGNGALVEQNIVRDTMRVLSDGGAIYSFGAGSFGNTIRHNIIERVHGNRDGSRFFGAVGIYLDNDTSFCVVEHNVVVDASTSGLVVNAAAHDHRLTGNLAYGMGHGLQLSDWLPAHVFGNRIEHNSLYTLSPESRPMVLESTTGWYAMGTYEGNRYYNPYDRYAVRASQYTNSPQYTLAGWRQQNPGNDLLSRQHFLRLLAHPVRQVTGAENLGNGDFTTDIAGWTAWAGSGSAVATWSQPLGFVGGALRLDVVGAGNPYGLVYRPGFAVGDGQWYRLRFRARAAAAVDVQLQLQRHAGDYAVLQDLRWVPVDQRSTRFELTFRAGVTEPQARLNFLLRTAGTVWLDEVSLVPVTVDEDPARTRSPVFVNASDQPRSFPLVGPHRDLDGRPVTSPLVVPPWSGAVLVRQLP